MLVVKWTWGGDITPPEIGLFYDDTRPTLFEVMERYLAHGEEFTILSRFDGTKYDYYHEVGEREYRAHKWEREAQPEE